LELNKTFSTVFREEIVEREHKLSDAIKKTIVNVVHPIDTRKKLLILDLDNTLLDFNGTKFTFNTKEIVRPGMYEFLQAVWPQYNIGIWSATPWSWVEMKLTETGFFDSHEFKISFVLDKTSMFYVKSSTEEFQWIQHRVKALQIVWSKFPEYSEKNTIHVDDVADNFALNETCGIPIKPFKFREKGNEKDTELLDLALYLNSIASLEDLSVLNHSLWKNYT